VLNGILDLSPREMDVFALLIKVDYEWRQVLPGDIKNILSTDNRRGIMREATVNKNNLTKYINIMKDKGLIVEIAENCWQVAPQLLPNMNSGIIMVLFILDTNETS
jgi:hypothetical protein